MEWQAQTRVMWLRAGRRSRHPHSLPGESSRCCRPPSPLRELQIRWREASASALICDYPTHKLTRPGIYMIEHVKELSSGKRRASWPLSLYSHHPDHLQNKVCFHAKHSNQKLIKWRTTPTTRFSTPHQKKSPLLKTRLCSWMLVIKIMLDNTVMCFTVSSQIWQSKHMLATEG